MVLRGKKILLFNAFNTDILYISGIKIPWKVGEIRVKMTLKGSSGRQ